MESDFCKTREFKTKHTLQLTGTVFMPRCWHWLGSLAWSLCSSGISISFYAMHITAPFGNFLLLVTSNLSPASMNPYIFSWHVWVTDITLSTLHPAKMLGLFWFHSPEIYFDASFFRYGSSIPSSVLSQVFCWPWPWIATWHQILWDMQSFYPQTPSLRLVERHSERTLQLHVSSSSNAGWNTIDHCGSPFMLWTHGQCEAGRRYSNQQDLRSLCGFHYTLIWHNLHHTGLHWNICNCLQSDSKRS